MAAEVRTYLFTGGRATSGRAPIHFNCPFCEVAVTAYRWSLAGSGKRCSCGAKFDACGRATREEA